MRASACLLAAALAAPTAVDALELTGRFSLFGAAAQAQSGQLGHIPGGSDTPAADQQSLRLMLDDATEHAEWSLHVKAFRQHLRGFPAASRHPSELFRYRPYAGAWHERSDAASSTRVAYELDRALLRRGFGNVRVGIGRQPVDWGSGRFWQPHNVFGAFAPVDLDTDFKPGIDAAVIDWYPSASSSLTAVYAFASRASPTISDSAAVHYRRQVGERAEMALLAGRVIANDVFGASFASDWAGIGWRLEAARTSVAESGEDALFWIAGLDYRFENGTLVTAEWHDNGRGATREAALGAMAADSLVAAGLQQHLGRRILGLAVDRDLTPLLRGGYKLLVGVLRDDAGNHRATSMLHQLSLVYSVSDESDLLLALQFGRGKSLDALGAPRSEFGHLPRQLTLRLRTYF